MTCRLASTLLVALCAGACRSSDAPSPPVTRVVDPAALDQLAPELSFSAVRDVVRDEGSIWILDAVPPYLTRVSLRSGIPVLRFGWRGGGPAELETPVAIQPDPDSDGVVVWDVGRRRVVVFGASGSVLSATPLDAAISTRTRTDILEVTYADPWRIRTVGEHVLAGFFPGGVNRTRDYVVGEVRLTDPPLSAGTPVIALAEHASAADELRELAAVPLWDACDGTVVLWAPRVNGLVWYGHPGNGDSATLELPIEPRGLELDDVAAYLERMARLELGPAYTEAGIDFEALASARRDQFAALAPLVTEVRCASSRVAWLRTFDNRDSPLGRGRSWLRADRSGGIRAYDLPAGYAPLLFEERTALGVLEDPGGAQRLATWTIDG